MVFLLEERTGWVADLGVELDVAREPCIGLPRWDSENQAVDAVANRRRPIGFAPLLFYSHY